MSSEELTSRTAWFRSRFLVDDVALILVGFALTVQVMALLVTQTLLDTVLGIASMQTSNVALGGYWVGVIVVETVVIVLASRYSSLLPDWVTKAAKWAVIIGLAGYFYWLFVAAKGLPWATTMYALVAVCFYSVNRFDVLHIIFNAMAISLAVGVAVLMGFVASPRVILAFIILLTIWDMVAVWGSDWMDGAVAWAASWGLPVFVVIPGQFRVEMGEVFGWLQDLEEEPRPHGIAGILGVGDLAVPATLTVSGAVALPAGPGHPAVIGTIVGATLAMVLLRTTPRNDGESLPALTWLATGAAAGFAIGVVASPTSLVAVLGGGL